MNQMPNRRTVFLRSLLLSASTIGGGFVILAVMRRMYVEKLGWLSEEEMLDLASLAQSAPGAVAVNASILVGFRLCGISGAALSVLGTLIPPLGVMSLIAALYQGIRSLEWIGNVLLGMQAGVSAVILDTAIRMTASALHKGSAADRVLQILVFAVSLAVTVFTGIHSAFIILASAAVGVSVFLMPRLRRKMREERK